MSASILYMLVWDRRRKDAQGELADEEQMPELVRPWESVFIFPGSSVK